MKVDGGGAEQVIHSYPRFSLKLEVAKVVHYHSVRQDGPTVADRQRLVPRLSSWSRTVRRPPEHHLQALGGRRVSRSYIVASADVRVGDRAG